MGMNAPDRSPPLRSHASHSSRETLSRGAKVGLTALLLIASACVFRWSDASLDIDDALITYRYAENLAAGESFSYNRGERIIGTSTPLYTLLLAAGRLAGIPVIEASNAINLLASVASVGLTLALTLALTGSFAAGLVAGAVLLSASPFVRYSMAGMETPLYTLVILAALLAVVRRQASLAAVLAGLAVLMRLDGLAVAAAVCLAYMIERRRLPLRECLVIVALVLPWLVFATVWSGSPLPHSLLAKRLHLATDGGNRFWIWHWLFVQPWSGAWFLLPFAAVGLLRSLTRGALAQGWIASLLFLGLYLVAYTLVAIPFYEWYLMPVLPVLAVLSASGMWASVSFIARRLPALAQSSLLGLVALAVLVPHFREMRSSVAAFKEYVEKVEGTRVAVGLWLRERSRERDSIGTGAIGHVGYASRRRIVDMGRLVTPLGDEPGTLRADYYAFEEPIDEPGCSPLRVFETHLSVEPKQITIWTCVPEP
jgi:hypothetical protein